MITREGIAALAMDRRNGTTLAVGRYSALGGARSSLGCRDATPEETGRWKRQWGRWNARPYR